MGAQLRDRRVPAAQAGGAAEVPALGEGDGAGGLAAALGGAVAALAELADRLVFATVDVGGTPLQLVVAWLVAGGAFFTIFFRFVNVREFARGVRIVLGREDRGGEGEVSHFQALATAVSGTVGVGNVSHVAIAVSLGGPGAVFWLVVAGFLGMSSKFVECTLGVKYRRHEADGSFTGGPMFYLDRGLAARGWPRVGRALALAYAPCIGLGALGVGAMFQANQAYAQLVNATGGPESPLAAHAVPFGVALAGLTALVIVGGISHIARVTDKLVPFMALLYIGSALAVVAFHADRVPAAVLRIVAEAFSPHGATGGALGVAILAFRRAAFSNEAGIGSAAIAHSAARTNEPVTQGLVALLEPFIDTVVICALTGLVITVSFDDPRALAGGKMSGVELTSAAFAQVASWFPMVLAAVIFLFAYSTLISWSYYGLAGALYLLGARPAVRHGYNGLFLACVVVGCSAELPAIIQLTDALVFAMAGPNLIGLYWMAPEVKRDLDSYLARRRQGSGPA